MISKTGIHATLALAALARQQPTEYVGAVQIAKEIGAPPNYLGKLLKKLETEGLLESRKGFGGGFKLAKKAKDISLYDIIEPLEQVSRWNNCFLGAQSCNCDAPCAVHNRWSKIRNEYLAFLKKTTVKEIASKEITL